MARPRVSLCMIVRDEADSLPRCLASVQDLVDEMIVVDTGSLDGTPEVARSFGARVLSFPWRGSFSEARNFGIDRAGGDWVLVLDADEEMAPVSAPRFRQLLRVEDVEGYLFEVVDYLGDRPGVDLATNTSFCLFRNKPGYRYTRKIHEQIENEVLRTNPDAVTRHSGLRIFHHGYLRQKLAGGRKTERNLRLLEQELEESPDNFTHFNLGIEYLKLGRLEKALEQFELASQGLDLRLAFAAELQVRTAITLLQLKRQDDALGVLDRAIEMYPRYTDLYYQKGEVFFEQGRFGEALASFSQCLHLGEPPKGYNSFVGVGSFRAAYNMGLVHEELLNNETAGRYYQKALAFNPRFYPGIQALSRLILRGKVEGGVSRLEGFFDLGNASSYLLLANLCFDEGLPQHGLGYLGKAEETGASPEVLVPLKAKAYFRLGRFKAAIDLLLPLVSKVVEAEESPPPDLLRLLCLCLCRENRSGEALKLVAGVSPGSATEILRRYIVLTDPSLETAGTREDRFNPVELLDLMAAIVPGGDAFLLEKGLQIMQPVEDLDVWLRLGKLYYRYGLRTMALEELRDCYEKGAFDPESLLLLGGLLLEKAEDDLAVEVLHRGIQEYPGSPRAIVALIAALGCRAARVAGGYDEGFHHQGLLEASKKAVGLARLGVRVWGQGLDQAHPLVGAEGIDE